MACFLVGCVGLRGREESEMTSRFLSGVSLGIMMPFAKMGLTGEEIGWEVCILIIKF